MKTSHDVIVIGGGIIGTATAFYLSKAGLDVGLIEQKGLAAGTSGATMSNLCLHNRMPGPEWALAMDTWQVYRDLKDTLGYECEFDIVSSLMLIEKEEDIHWAEQRVSLQQSAGLKIELITRDALVKMDPYVNPKLAGAAYCHTSAWVNSMLLCKAFAGAAQKRGAKIYTNTCVKNICVSREKITGVKTSTGTFGCGRVVNAAGPAADDIGSLVGCDIPIRRNRGTIIVTESFPPMGIRTRGEGIDHARHSCDKMDRSVSGGTSRDNRDLERTYDVHFVSSQTRNGNFLIGRSGEDHQMERIVYREAIEAILQRAVRFVPRFAKIKILRFYAGIRPYSPDLLPMLGPVDSPEGFFLACGFGDKGIGLGAAGAKHVAGSILDKDYQIPNELMSQRFVKNLHP